MVCWKGERNCTRERPGLMIVVDARCVATGMLSADMRRNIHTDVPGVRRGEGKGAKGVGQHSCVSTSCRTQKYTVLVC